MKIEGISYSLTPLDDLKGLRACWTELETRSDCPFFLTWDWIGTWLSVTPGLSPQLLCARDGDKIVGLALFQPACIRRPFTRSRALILHRTGDPYTDIITIEYNGILADRAYAARIACSIFSFFRSAIKSSAVAPWDEIHVAMATDAVAQAARDTGLLVLELAHKPSWFINLKGIRDGASPYLDTLSSNTRHQIRRAIRLYEQRGPLLATAAQSFDEALLYFEEFKQLHQATWTARGKPGGFGNAYFETFHRALIARCIPRGTVELVRITAGDTLIGQVYNFIHRGQIYAYQTGFCYEDDARLKPGLVSHYLCAQRHLENGADVYDFMAGNNRYKANLGIPGPDLMHFVFQRPTLKTHCEILSRSIKDRLLGHS